MHIDQANSYESDRVLIDPQATSGYLLDTEDFGAYNEEFTQEPQPVHFTELVGSTDPGSKVAYQFFKWIDSDKYLSYVNFFNHFGVIDPIDDPDFNFIYAVAFRPNTPERHFLREFLNGITSILESIDGHLEDLLTLRGLAIEMEEYPGVPVRTLSHGTPPKFNSKENWPQVNAAWIGELTTTPGEFGNYYIKSFAICLSCEERLTEVYWYDAIEWVATHNSDCKNE